MRCYRPCTPSCFDSLLGTSTWSPGFIVLTERSAPSNLGPGFLLIYIILFPRILKSKDKTSIIGTTMHHLKEKEIPGLETSRQTNFKNSRLDFQGIAVRLHDSQVLGRKFHEV